MLSLKKILVFLFILSCTNLLSQDKLESGSLIGSNNHQTDKIEKEINKFHGTFGLGLGTFTRNREVYETPLNFEFEAKIHYSLNQITFGAGMIHKTIPSFFYYDKFTSLNITSIGTEVSISNKNYLGVFLVGGIELPLSVNDSRYFDRIAIVSPELIKKTNIIPSVGLGYSFEGFDRFTQFLLSYKYYAYSNEYRFQQSSTGLNFYRFDEIRFGTIQLSFRLILFKKRIERKI